MAQSVPMDLGALMTYAGVGARANVPRTEFLAPMLFMVKGGKIKLGALMAKNGEEIAEYARAGCRLIEPERVVLITEGWEAHGNAQTDPIAADLIARGVPPRQWPADYQREVVTIYGEEPGTARLRVGTVRTTGSGERVLSEWEPDQDPEKFVTRWWPLLPQNGAP